MERNRDAYLNFVCQSCFNKLDECTCEVFPPYGLIFIDQNIQEHIRILRNKGYRTSGCCESHYNSDCNNIYISFGSDYGFGSTIPLPEGFTFMKRKCAIVYKYKSKIKEADMLAEKELKLKELLDWCNNLPEIEQNYY